MWKIWTPNKLLLDFLESEHKIIVVLPYISVSERANEMANSVDPV